MNKYKRKRKSHTNDELIEELRTELHETISCDELESSWSSDSFERLIMVLQVDPVSFHRLWMQPLLDAGVSADVAVSCIAKSYLQPN